MSSFVASGGLLSDDPVTLTNGSATVVFTAVGVTLIASIVVTPTSGTPNLTIEIYNAAGSKVMTLRKAVVMTAGTPFIYNEAFTINPGQTIRVTSSSGSGDMDVQVTKGIDAAAARGRESGR